MPLPDSRVDSIRLVGGRPCLDLLNTISWRGIPGRHQDHLTDAAACLVWSRRAGVLDDREAMRIDGADVRRPLLTLRRALEAHLVAGLPGRPDLGALEPAVFDALRNSHLVASDGGARWRVQDLDVRTPARRVALDLLDLLTDPPGPLRRCDDPSCGWVFVDTSRGHRRRWCSSTDCGNRDRVRRHATRARTR